MKIFTCTHCESSICTCTIRENGKPFICPKGYNKAEWHEVKKTAPNAVIAKEGE